MKKQLSSVIAMLMCLTCLGACDVVEDTKDFFVDSYNKVESWVGGLLGIEPGEQTPEAPKYSVALDKTTLSLDRYEDDTLVATVTNENGEAVTETVTWTSSDPAVATVVNGFVEATGAGTATITATVGGVSATCEVTVEDSGALPVLNVGEDTIEALVGDTYALEAVVSYKRQPVDATISYQISDPTVATIDENGVITALKYGTVTLTVSASWKNVDVLLLTETITLNVREDVAVALQANGDTTIYTSAITVSGTEFKNTTTFAASVLVNGSADGVDASKITWTSSNPDVLTVENGVITAVGEGKANVTVSYTTDAQTYVSTPVEVTVAFPVVEKDVKVYLDASKTTIGGQISASEVFGNAGVTIARVFEYGDSEDLTASTTWLKENDVGSELERTKKIVVATGEYGYAINALVITKMIRTADELASLQSYTEVTEGSSGVTYYSYSGYFVLANNIVATGEENPFKAPSMGSIGSANNATKEAGFHGTFDGQGYVVKGFKFDIGGIFGDIGDGAVIKNVAFEDCDAAWRNFTAAADGYARQDGVGVLAANAAGNYLIENVFVEATGNGASCGALVGRSMKGGTVKNTVVIYNATGGWNFGAVSSWAISAPTVENLYVIMQGKSANLFHTAPAEVFANGSTYTVVAATEDATAITYSNLPTDYWFVADGMVPVFKTMVDEFVLSETEVSVDENGEVTLVASLKDIAGGVITNKAVWTSSDNEIATVENGVLTIKSVGTVVITATFAGYTATCEVEITEAQMVVEDKTAVRLNLEAKSTKGVSEQVIEAGVKAGLFESFEVTSVTDASGNAIDNATYLATADANNSREATLIVYAADKGYKVSVLVATKIITEAQQLVDILDYATNVTVTEASGYKTYSYGGYFVLGNNLKQDANNPITFGTLGIGTAGDNKVVNISSQNWVLQDGTAGFHGTFDGQGYAIDGFSYGVGGVFGFIGSGAVIKNVAFTNCATGDGNNTTRNEAVLAHGAIGSTSEKWLIDNVYVQGTMNGIYSGMLVGYMAYNGKISNTVARIKFTGSISGLGSISYITNKDTFSVDNFVGVYEYDAGRYGRDYKPFGQGSNFGAPAGAFAEYELRDGALRKITEKTYGNDISAYTVAESAPTAAEFAAFNSAYWTVTEGQAPVFNAKN